MQRSYQYRLYPNAAQASALETILCQSRLLYSEALAHRRDVYKHAEQSVSYVDQWNRFREDRKARLEDFGLLNAAAVQQLLRRLDKTFAAFFRRIRNGDKPGFPRFKSATRFRSMEYRHGDGCKLHGAVRPQNCGRDLFYLQHVGKVRIRLHRPVPEGCLKHVTLTRKTGGRWLVCFAGDDGVEPPPLRTGKAVGIDKGLRSLLAFSDGTRIDNPRWLRTSLARLRRAQRALARKAKGGSNRCKQAQRVARLYEKIANQRKDFWHKITNRLTQTYALVAVEDLPLGFITKNRHLALSAHDAGLGMFQAMLDYKAERAGCAVVAVDPKHTSQVCSGCGQIAKKSLRQRWHSCSCGVELDRDVNAAVNILYKARCGPLAVNVDAVRSCVGQEAVCFS